jgi:anti-sigma factor RsiW
MNCDELVELVTAYLEGSLSEAERVAFEAHLAECPGCDRYLAQFHRTIELLGELPDDALSVPGRQLLLDAFTHRRRGSDPEGDA